MALIMTDGVIQKRSKVTNTRTTMNSANGWHELATNYRHTITPVLSGSRIYLEFFITINQDSGVNKLCSIKFQRSTDGGSNWSDIANLGEFGVGNRRPGISTFRPYGYDSNDATDYLFTGIDNAGTTGTITYRAVFYAGDGAPNWFVLYSNANGTGWQWTGTMTFTLTEIGS